MAVCFRRPDDAVVEFSLMTEIIFNFKDGDGGVELFQIPHAGECLVQGQVHRIKRGFVIHNASPLPFTAVAVICK